MVDKSSPREGIGIRYNKDVWTLITGLFVSSAEDAVSYELDKAERQLYLGINVFKRSESNKAADEKLKSSETEDMRNFLERLVLLLDVDMVVAYELLGFYVLYEFRGSADGMRDMINVEGHKDMLIQDIWLFYRSERMFLLKCINFLWTYFYDSEHKFHELYTDVLSNHSAEDTFRALAKQIVSVMDERMPTIPTHGRCMTERFQAAWFISNMREQIQTIHNMIVYLEFYDCTPKEFQYLYSICKGHSFGYSHDPPPAMFTEFEYFREIIGQLLNILLLTALKLQSTNVESSKLFTDGAVFRSMGTEMEALGTQYAHGPMILVWMSLVVHPGQPFLEAPPDFLDKFGGCAFKIKVFSYLAKLLKSSTFQNSKKLKRIAFDCIEELVCTLVGSFSVETLVPMPGLFELVGTLLTDEMVTNRIWASDRSSGLWLIINEAMRIFPKQFIPFASIVKSTASCGPENITSLMNVLENLQTYMEASRLSMLSQFEETSDSENRFQLTSPRHPADGNLNVTFAAGTFGRFQSFREPSIQWECRTNFFDILNKKLSELLAEISRGSSYVSAASYSQALVGIKCLHELVESQCTITEEVSQAISIVFNLLERFSMGAQSPGELLAACLDVACAMLTSRPDIICRRLTAMKFLPVVDISRCTNPSVIARGDFFHMRTVGFVVTNHECASGKYPLLLAYLRFVDRVMQPNEGDTFSATLESNIEIILPCLVFVVTTVFPNYDTWTYEDPDSDRGIISYHCLRLMHLILSPDSSSELSVVMDTLKELPRLKDSVKRIAPYLLHQTALYSLLETDASVALIKVIGVGDRFLQELMERQPNWLEGCGVLFTNNLILAMSILNRVLLYKNTFCTDNEMSNIEVLLLNQPPTKARTPASRHVTSRPSSSNSAGPTAATSSTPTAIVTKKPKNRHELKTGSQPERMVHIIANYIFHSFNPKLPVMAVRLLKRFATEFSTSLLSCLGPDGGQICQQFLFRLNSRRESNDLKVAILELMTSAIASQPGLSEAFLNLTSKSKQEYSSLGYISGVLDQLQTAPETVAVSIHHNVISLIHALWTTYCQRVLDHIRRRVNFWDGVCAPFFLMPVSKEITLYYKIIVICTLEMKWFGPKMAPTLAKNLKKFLDFEETHFARWSEFVATTFVGKNEAGITANDVEELALAWKNFLTVLVNYSPFNLAVEQKKMIVTDTMKMLLTELESGDNQTVIMHVADAMLILITNWKLDCLAELTVATTAHLQTLLELLASSYTKHTPDAKESLLAFSLRLITLLGGQISADAVLSSSVMTMAVIIATTELTLITNSPPPLDSVVHVHSTLAATLSVCLVQKMVSIIGNTSLWQASLNETKLIHQLMDAAQLSLETPKLFNLALVSLDTLLLLSYTDFSKTLVLFKVGSKLFMPLTPPIETMGDGLPWFMGKWNRIYERGLRLVTRLLSIHERNFVADAISFVGIHEPYIIAILLGIRHCVNPDLLRLAVVTLDFLQTLQQFGVWKEDHPSSFFNINRCVVSTLDRCIAYMLQPYILRAAVECPKPFERTQFGPSPFWAASAATDSKADFQTSPAVAGVINRLLECINMCLTVLYPLSPSYLSVMTDVLDTEVPIVPLVEATYLTPAVEQDPQGRLTLGTILSVISLSTRAIGQKGNEIAPGMSPAKAIQSSEKYLSELSVPQLTYALEISLSFMLAQTLVSATNTNLSQSDRKKIMLTFVMEMVPHVDSIKRFVLGEELERQLTPSAEKSMGGGALKRQSNGGRSNCSRRLQFTTGSQSKRAIIDADPVTRPTPLESPERKALTLRGVPRYQRTEPLEDKRTHRQYIQMMMYLYQSCFVSALR